MTPTHGRAAPAPIGVDTTVSARRDLARFVETNPAAVSATVRPHVLPASAYWRAAASSTAASWREALTSRIPGNVMAGVTVALVALPLNMALAIACGLPASVGLITGAVAGVLGAILGGARLQITGPEVALAPITFELLTRHGLEGLLAVTVMAGLIQIAFGVLRVGRLVHAIPVPVIAGFLAAVGIMVFDSQLPVLLGVSDQARLVTELDGSILAGVSWPTVAVGLLTIALLVGVPKFARRVPAPLVGLGVAMAAVAVLQPSIAMVDSITGGWPVPALPSMTRIPFGELFAEAFALALIASIDSLLCAVSIDTRTGSSGTRTDQELVAQGIANVGSACFGGMPVAAAIVRSAAAVEAGATSRLAPLVQSIVLALVVLAFGSVVGHIPLVALAGILLVVGWRLVDWGLLRQMWTSARFEVGVAVATAVGILLTDFVIGVLVGVLAALAEFAYRQRALLRMHAEHVHDDMGVRVVRLHGPLFFGSQAQVARIFEAIVEVRVVVVDLQGVPTLDSSGAGALARSVERLRYDGIEVWLTALPPGGRTLLASAIDGADPGVRLLSSVDAALRRLARRASEAAADTSFVDGHRPLLAAAGDPR